MDIELDRENELLVERYTLTVEAVVEEIARARRLHPGLFASTHEGYAVLLEEVRELEAVVFSNSRKKPGRCAQIYEEAIQVAAMAIRLADEASSKSRCA